MTTMLRTCGGLQGQDLHRTELVRTAATPKGVEVGICVNCDRRKCGKCRLPVGPSDSRCRRCGNNVTLVAP